MVVESRVRVRVRYEPRGAALEVFERREPEVLLSGPAGTGKSRACLEKVHLCAAKYRGMRGLVVRKTRASLTESAMVTFERHVLHPLDGVRWHDRTQEYRYPNGSVIVVAGLDKASKVMSSEYDLAFVQEATELAEGDWEALTTRLRNGAMPYQQVIADCNPDSPVHWLKQRCDAGRTVMLESRHEDNPAVTPEYMEKLDRLTGVRFLRLRRGIWAAAEGLVYEGWDRAVHLVDAVSGFGFQVSGDRGREGREGQEGREYGESHHGGHGGTASGKVDGRGIPVEWARYWVVDFGYTHPFVWQAWCEDGDGRLYRYREIYRTGRLVEDHAREILKLTEGEPRPRAVVCDHDAEDRATLERHLGMNTIRANKVVSPGIQAVASRLRPAGDGRPRLMLVREALVGKDPALVEAKLPTCTEEEVEGYVWDLSSGRKRGEQPVKVDDHGMDCLRYMVAHRDVVMGRRAMGRRRGEEDRLL